MVAQALVAMSFVVLITRRISKGEPLATLATPVRFNDLGNLLLTFVMLWAYFSFFSIPADLVGKFARGNLLVYEPRARKLGPRWPWC